MSAQVPASGPATLRRSLGLGLLTIYGVGIMVGAGIYVLIGEIAGRAGPWAPLAFVLAALAAAPTALAYAELSSRIPRAAGEAAYVEAGLGRHWLAVAVGLAIVASGIVSAGAVLRGGVGYLAAFTDLPAWLLIVVLGGALIVVAIVGVLESVGLAAAFTAIEVAGLGLVIWAGFAAEPVVALAEAAAPHLPGLGAAAILAFFAFIGFEDLVNMAEEAHAPRHVMPLAILLALAITTGLYLLVAVAAVRAVPIEDLAASPRPLALVWEAGLPWPSHALSAIAVVAALNGVLAQLVMAARVLFGLGRNEGVLAWAHRVAPRFGTPARATWAVGAALVVAALALPVDALARLTTSVLLVVYALVNLSLIRLKRKSPEAPFRVPGLVPWAGLVTTGLAMAVALGALS